MVQHNISILTTTQKAAKNKETSVKDLASRNDRQK